MEAVMEAVMEAAMEAIENGSLFYIASCGRNSSARKGNSGIGIFDLDKMTCDKTSLCVVREEHSDQTIFYPTYARSSFIASSSLISTHNFSSITTDLFSPTIFPCSAKTAIKNTSL